MANYTKNANAFDKYAEAALEIVHGEDAKGWYTDVSLIEEFSCITFRLEQTHFNKLVTGRDFQYTALEAFLSPHIQLRHHFPVAFLLNEETGESRAVYGEVFVDLRKV